MGCCFGTIEEMYFPRSVNLSAYFPQATPTFTNTPSTPAPTTAALALTDSSTEEFRATYGSSGYANAFISVCPVSGAANRIAIRCKVSSPPGAVCKTLQTNFAYQGVKASSRGLINTLSIDVASQIGVDFLSIKSGSISEGAATIPYTLGSTVGYLTSTVFSFCIQTNDAATTATASAAFNAQAASGLMLYYSASAVTGSTGLCSSICYGDGGQGSLSYAPPQGSGNGVASLSAVLTVLICLALVLLG